MNDPEVDSFGELCLIMNMAPATMYSYIKMMKNVFLDIRFENGIFECISLIEEATQQKELPE